MKYIKLMVLAGFFTIFLYSYVGAGMAEYSASPTFVTQAVPPNILIILDNSDSMNELAYKTDNHSGTSSDPYQNFDPTKTYYGYFDSSASYTYLNGQFSTSSTGQWDGNFLNWLTMRRIDVTRKVLAGGKQTPPGNENSTNKLLGADNTNLDYEEQNWKSISSADSYTPDTDETKYYVASGEFCHEDSYYDGSCYYSKNIDIDVSDVSEPHTGILQEFWDQARFGLMYFNRGDEYELGDNSVSDGGKIKGNGISGANTDLMTYINNHSPDSNTPLAESLYEAIRYFRNSNSAYNGGTFGTSSDPVQDWCQKNFVLLLSDGESWDDLNVPGGHFSGADDTSPTVSDPDPDYDLESFMNAINATHYNNKLNTGHGSYYLEGLSYYAHTNDLRSDYIGIQNLSIYTVFAFGNSNKAESLLKTSAKYGGFEDKNDNDEPDLQAEWDENEDGIPDTYYEAQDGSELENKLTSAINDILERASSGTAVSVLATSQEGEGNIVQAYFRPKVTQETRTLEWLGYVHSLWVDSQGNLREDTNDNNALDLTEDNVVRTYTDSSTAETKAEIYDVNSTNKYPDEDENATKEVELQDIKSVWNAGERLEQTNATDRDIFTYLDQDNDNEVDNGEVVDFKTSNDDAIKPYLGVADDTTSSHLGDTLGERVDNVIDFVRGKEIDGLRTRKMSNGTIWKLGDIVHSTPMIVSGAVENYHALYGRESYDDYVKDQKDRETMVYVGANDGLLHAFTSWKYDKDAQEYVEPNSTGPNEKIGDEVWAYAPQNLLPHLKWLPDPNYSHVYYVDQKPRVFDAKIRQSNKWGTFVLCGMRLGGKHIQAEGDFDGDTNSEVRDFNSAYFLLDVTEPRNPKVMWERSYEGLNLTTSRPAIMRVQGDWYAVFGSGPENYDGTSGNTGKMYVVDLETGQPMGSSEDWLRETNEGNAFMGSPVAFDRATNYNVDAAYIGATHDETDGKLYKLAVPVTDASGASGDYDLQPSNYETDPGNWKWKTLFDPEGDRPITAAPSISIDKKDNVWIYGGTGRYFREADKTNTDTQILFGIKDPFYNHGGNDYHEYDFDSLDTSSLENVSGIRVTSEGVVYDNDDNLYEGDDNVADGEWNSLVSDVESDDGWFFKLDETGERILEKPAVLGGAVMSSSFIPNEDVCGYGGDSNLYAVYYTTGTAYTEPIFGTRDVYIGSDLTKINRKKLSLGSGKASSISLHVGKEEGATGIIQESTGNIEEVDVNPAMDIKSGILYWKAE